MVDLNTRPLVRIITLAKDDEEGLTLTRWSVQNQTYSDLVHTIVPGPSFDRTLEIARKWAVSGETELWDNAPPGIYPAMNFALAKARDNEYLLYLNSGDFLLHPQAIEAMVTACHNTDRDWTKAGFATVGPRGWIRDVVIPNDDSLGGGGAGHQASLIDARSLRASGGFDSSYQIFADSKLLRSVQARERPAILKQLVVAYSRGGYSSQHPLRAARELKRLNAEVPINRPRSGWRSDRRRDIGMLLSRIERKLDGRLRIPDSYFRARAGRKSAIQDAVEKSPHWNHSRLAVDSLSCCLFEANSHD